MSDKLNKYLDRVMVYANCAEEKATGIRHELEDHLCIKIEELQKAGLQYEEAVSKAIEDHGHPRTVGYALRPHNAWIDIRTHGTARGFIAIGPKAVGIFAFGGQAYGVFTLGAISIGLFSWGGLALALLFSWGGVVASLLGVAYGGCALAPVASGGVAAGIISTGGAAYGFFVPSGGQIHSVYTLETLPTFIEWMWSFCKSYIPDFSHNINYNTGNWILLLSFFTFMVPMSFLQNKETKRLQEQDPYFAE